MLLVLTTIAFTALNSRYISANAQSLLLQQVAVIACLAIGQTLVILTAGIDLSVGAVTILAMMVMATLAAENGVPAILAIAIGVALAVGAGFLNGVLVTRVNLPPFIVTLGTLSIFTAVALLYSGGSSIQNNRLPDLINVTGKTFSIGGFRVTVGVVMVLVLYALVGFALSQTAWGRHVFAVGDDAESARLSGVESKRVLLSVYTVAGLIYGLAAWIQIGRAGAATPNGIPDANLDSITAVVIGGTVALRRPRRTDRQPPRRDHRRCVHPRALARRGRPAVAAPRDRRPRHRRGLGRPVDPEGQGMSTIERLPLTVDHLPEEKRRIYDAEPILSARDMVITFGRVIGLDGVDLDLYKGEVLAVIGDNGAGKSTLIKCLTGAYVPDSGQIYVDGKSVTFQSAPGRAGGGHRDGLPAARGHPGARHREQPLPGREERRPGPLGSVLRMLDKKGMKERAGDSVQKLGIQTIQNMGQAVETLSGGQRQAVAVARAAAFGSNVVVLDEPTAALGVKESGMVLDMIKQLRDNGLAVILISHNMPHVFEAADRIHIQRLGGCAGVITPQSHDMGEGVAIMTGATTLSPS